MTVIQYESPPPLPESRPGDELERGPAGDVARLRAAAEYANYIGNTDFVPEPLRGNPAAITAALLAGDELGLQKMAALRTIAMIRGRPTLTSEAQRGLILSRGHEIWFEESTVTRAIVAGRRAGSDRIGRITWTMDDARRAGLANQPNYSRYPAEMLRARSSAALARAMFADVTLGIPASEELEGEPDNGMAPTVDVPPSAEPSAPPRQRTRRRKTAAAPAAQPVPPTPPPDEQPQPKPDEPLATEAYLRRIFATMRDLGVGSEGSEDERRAERLLYTSHVARRRISSSNELTIGEAGRVIDQLDADIAALAVGQPTLLDQLRAGALSAQGPAVEGGDQPAAPSPAAAHGPTGAAGEAEIEQELRELGAREVPAFQVPADVQQQLDEQANGLGEVDGREEPERPDYNEFPEGF